MAKLKTVLTFMLVGAFLGNLLATLVAPSFLVTWYTSTSLATASMCDPEQVVNKVTSQFIQAQLTGTGIGAVAFLVLGILFVRYRAKKQKGLPPTPPTPGPA